MRQLVTSFVCLACVAFSMGVRAPQDQPSRAVAPAPTVDATSLDALAFLQGTWRGTFGDAKDAEPVEEIWSAPLGNSIMGCFRWAGADGSARMMEMLAITKDADAIRLRLRHYTPQLGAKEDADKPITMKLSSIAPNRAVFSAEKDAADLASVSYAVANGALKIDVAFKTKPGEQPRETLSFTLKKS